MLKYFIQLLLMGKGRQEEDLCMSYTYIHHSFPLGAQAGVL